MIYPRIFKGLVAFSPFLLAACALLDSTTSTKPGATTGLIATPPAYYSTAKAKYLGTRYKDNLDRMVERIVRNPRTVNLQFANNISSVGGIGFFTHSATVNPDERYLEVVLATPETFETKGEYNEKVQRLVSHYGLDLLGILSGDADLFQDKELSGYGLNFAWRTILTEPAGPRVTVERAILYFPKDRVRNFLRQEIKQNDLLAGAVIFAVEDDGPLSLVSYRPQEPRPDVRPVIREDNLVAPSIAAIPVDPSPSRVKDETQNVKSTVDLTKNAPPMTKEVATSSPLPTETKGAVKPPVSAGQKPSPVPPHTSLAKIEPDEKLSPGAPVTDALAPVRVPKTAAQIAPAIEQKNDAAQAERSIDKALAARRPSMDSPEPPIAVVREPEAVKPAPLAAPRNIPQPAKLEPISEAKAAAVSLAPPTIAREPDKPRLAEASSTSPVKMAEIKTAARVIGKPPVAKLSEPSRASEDNKPLAVQSPAKIESVAMESKPVAMSTALSPVDKSKEKPAGEQIALLPNKAAEAAPAKPIVARTAPKRLEGFIIQLAFNDKDKAQRWAETMEKRGYAVSVTEAGSEGALRVRLGNFAGRDDAERQLRTFKQEGLNGIILNLPQAFRPETRSSVP